MDNKEKMNDINIINTINDNKKNFPDNNLMIKKIFRDNNYILVDLLDKYCPIYKDNHDREHVYLEMTPKNGIILKCRCEECRGKIYPNNVEIKININNVFNITNNNIIVDDETEIEYLNITENEDLNKLLTESINGNISTVYDIANVMFYLYKDQYRYDKINKNWYFFDNRWKITNNLRSKISKEILDLYKKTKQVILKIEEVEEKKHIKISKLKKVNNLIDNLKSTAFKNNIITECAEIFNDNFENDENIIDLLDTNPYLIGFNNGVYDAINNIFRKSEFNDYVSMSVGYDYKEVNQEKYNRLLKFLEDIQPIKEDRDYLLTYLSTCLFGTNELQHFVILTGENGRNGKSKLTELLSFTFGNYFSSIKSKMLTKPSPDAQTPDPMLLDLMKKKIVIASEPEKTDKLNTGYIKLLTGKDKAKIRKCHSNDMIEFTINFRIILLCNKIPEVDDPNDIAYQRRLKCINFPIEFVENPTKENHKKIDHTLVVDDLKLEFIHLLIDYYSKYTKYGMPNSININNMTEAVKKNSNQCIIFMEEFTEYSVYNIHTSKLYEAFKNWFKLNYPNEKIMSNRGFINSIKNNYIIYDKVKMPNVSYSTTGIKNIQLKNLSIDI